MWLEHRCQRGLALHQSRRLRLSRYLPVCGCRAQRHARHAPSAESLRGPVTEAPSTAGAPAAAPAALLSPLSSTGGGFMATTFCP